MSTTVKPLNILAIISSFNEEDVIYYVIKDLIENGINVYLIDNCSTDNTVQEAKKLLGHGLIHIERFPDDSGFPERSKKEYLWHLILKRKQQIIQNSDADWFIHADADEFRESPFPGTSLSEGITFVDRLGYNAINFSLYNFRPTDNTFIPHEDVRNFLTFYEPGRWFDHNQIKAWKNTGMEIDLVSTGGHSVAFAERRIFPIPFILRHYPIRSEEHGRRKVMQERAARFAKEELAVGWHVQYDEFINSTKNYLWDRNTLRVFDSHEIRENLLAQAFRRFLMLHTDKQEPILQLENILSVSPSNLPALKELGNIFSLFADKQSVALIESRIEDVLQSQKEKEGQIKPIGINPGQFEDGKHLKVSIVVPVFNRYELTQKCLESLYNYTPTNLFEVIIIDNASSDKTQVSLEQLEKTLPNFHYIRNEDNLGFAKANNIGAKNAKGKYVLCLNNDTEFFQPWLEPMVELLDNDMNIGAVGAKLLFPDRTIQHAGVVLFHDSRIENSLVAIHSYYGKAENTPDTRQTRIYPALTAACLLLRKNEFLELGGFDEHYWNGYEDVDLCLRLRETGKILVFQPKSTLFHHESKSGPERFVKVDNNIRLLNERWLGKTKVNFTVDKDGNIEQSDFMPAIYQPDDNALTSIVIPLYNNVEYTRQCIESLEVSTQLPFEVILVDNASTDGTNDYLESLKTKSDKYLCIRNTENIGFPGAVNQGIKASSGEYIVIANNDLIFTPQWLDRLIQLLKSDKRYGLAGPMSNFVSGVQIDKEAKYTTIEQMHAYAAKKLISEKGKFFEFPRVAFLCVLLKRQVIEKLGGLDERFAPGNFEDDDYCLRAQKAGYKCVVAKDVFIHHFGSKSFLADGEKKYLARLEQNRKIFIQKWQYDPNEIWLQGKQPRERNISIPFHQNRYAELAARMQTLIAENDFETAKMEVDKILKLAEDPANQVSDTERSYFVKLQDKLSQLLSLPAENT